MALVLTRSPGQQIKIGNRMLTLCKIERGSVTLKYDDHMFGFRFFNQEHIEPNVQISVKPATSNSVRVCIEAPREIDIVRTELINRSPR